MMISESEYLLFKNENFFTVIFQPSFLILTKVCEERSVDRINVLGVQEKLSQAQWPARLTHLTWTVVTQGEEMGGRFGPVLSSLGTFPVSQTVARPGRVTAGEDTFACPPGGPKAGRHNGRGSDLLEVGAPPAHGGIPRCVCAEEGLAHGRLRPEG